MSALTRTWLKGAPEREGPRHPFRLNFDALAVGDTVNTAPRTITLQDIEHFAHFTSDAFYAHMDEDAAKANPFFPGRVAHGYLVLSFAAGLFVDPAPGPLGRRGVQPTGQDRGALRAADDERPAMTAIGVRPVVQFNEGMG